MSFTLFAGLPPELRAEIWQLSCHHRVVQVSYNSANDSCTTTTALPAVLQTCHESRYEGMRIYKRAFGTKTRQAGIFFCPWLDTLYLPRPNPMGYDDTSRAFVHHVTNTEEVINLAIDHVPPTIRKPWETYNKYVLMSSFPLVTEVTLVLNSGEKADKESGEIDLYEPMGNTELICDLLAAVEESFLYEAGVEFASKKTPVEHRVAPSLVLKSKVATPIA